jgi:hypothetical protein
LFELVQFLVATSLRRWIAHCNGLTLNNQDRFWSAPSATAADLLAVGQ